MEKGFTLIELLAVIVILGIILVIAIPTTQNIIESSKNKAYDLNVIQFKNATDKYVLEHSRDITGLETDDIGYVTLETLTNEKYIGSALKNPKTGNNYSNSAVVRVAHLEGNEYQYDFFIDGQPPLLSSKFSVANASANGATGTYTAKNGSNYFVGANPNNFIEFGHVSSSDNTTLLWRIIKSDSNGIKIVYDGVSDHESYRMEDYGMITIDSSITTPWDTTNSNKWLRPSSLQTQLLTWYANLYDENKFIYTKSINWCIGGVIWNGPTTTAQFIQNECINSVAAGGTFTGLTTYSSPAGLLKPSEYISTSSAATCSGSYQISGNNYGRDCGNLVDGTVTNFLYKYYMWWLANAVSGSTDRSWIVDGSGEISSSNPNDTEKRVRPVVNLKPVVTYDSGDGSVSNPYRIN